MSGKRWSTLYAAGTEFNVQTCCRHSALAEPGCVGYEIFQSVDGPTQLVLVERYVDRAALDAHTRSAHYQELVAERIRPLLTDRQVHFLEAVDVGQSDLDNG